jgi:hypothetical protein
MGISKNPFSTETAIKLFNPVKTGIQNTLKRLDSTFYKKERLAALFSLPLEASAFLCL